MTTDIATLGVELDTRQLRAGTTDLNRFVGVSNKAANSASALGASLKGALIGSGIGIAFGAIIKNTIEADREVALLTRTLQNNRGALTLSIGQLQAYAMRMQSVTTFSDEAVLSTQRMLIQIGGMTDKTLPRATQAAADLAAAFGEDITSAAGMMARAIKDPEQGLMMLNRKTRLFTDEQKKALQAMVDTGHAAEAQEIILGAVERAYKGTATAARDTLGGALSGLKNAFGDLLEGQGGVNDVKSSVEELTGLLQEPQMVTAFQSVSSAIVSAAGFLATALAELVDKIKLVSTVYAAFTTNGPGAQKDRMDYVKQFAAYQARRAVGMVDSAIGLGYGAGDLGTSVANSAISLTGGKTQLRELQRPKTLEDTFFPAPEAAPTAKGYADALNLINNGLLSVLTNSDQLAVVGLDLTDATSTQAMALYKKTQEDLKNAEATKAAAKATDEYNKAIGGLRVEMNPYGTKLTELIALQQQTESRHKSGKLTAEEYAAALRDIQGSIAAINGELDPHGAKVDQLANYQRTLTAEYAAGRIGFDSYFAGLQFISNAQDELIESNGEVDQSLQAVGVTMESVSTAARDTLGASISGVFQSIRKGTFSLKESINSLADSFISAMEDMIAKTLAFYAIQSLLRAAGYDISPVTGVIAKKSKEGGPVIGPGTSTSDSVPILGSNGEYMIKASSVKKYGVGFMDAVNAGRYAQGGMIGRGAAGGSSASSPRITFHNDFKIDATGANPTSAANMLRGLDAALRAQEQRIFKALSRGYAST